MKKKLLIWAIISILIFVCFDFFSKVIVVSNYLNVEKYLIEGKLGFKPFLNTENLSFFNMVLHWDVPVHVLGLIGIVGMIIIICFYIDLYKKNRIGKLENWTFIMGISGIICSSLDKLIYGGSWDFIFFYKWIFDLKDIYVLIFQILFPIAIIKNIVKEIKLSKKN